MKAATLYPYHVSVRIRTALMILYILACAGVVPALLVKLLTH